MRRAIERTRSEQTCDRTGGKEFIIIRLPADPRIVVASPCSGHGTRFASAIATMLADVALDAKLIAPKAFQLDRAASPRLAPETSSGAAFQQGEKMAPAG